MPRSALFWAYRNLAKHPQCHTQGHWKSYYQQNTNIRVHDHPPGLMLYWAVIQAERLQTRPIFSEPLEWDNSPYQSQQVAPSQQGITFILQCAHCPWPCTHTICSGRPHAGHCGCTIALVAGVSAPAPPCSGFTDSFIVPSSPNSNPILSRP